MYRLLVPVPDRVDGLLLETATGGHEDRQARMYKGPKLIHLVFTDKFSGVLLSKVFLKHLERKKQW